MMDIKKIVKENPRILIYGLSGIIAAFFLYISVGQFLINEWPSERRIQNALEKLKKKQMELQIELNKDNILKKNRESYIKNSANFWINRRDGNPETNAQKRIEDAASAAGLQLNTIGRVQMSKISDAISTYDTSIQGTAPVDQIIAFIEQIYKRSPRFYWANISLSPDNIKNPQKVVLNGTLRFVSITDEEIISKILGEKDEKKKN